MQLSDYCGDWLFVLCHPDLDVWLETDLKIHRINRGVNAYMPSKVENKRENSV